METVRVEGDCHSLVRVGEDVDCLERSLYLPVKHHRPGHNRHIIPPASVLRV